MNITVPMKPSSDSELLSSEELILQEQRARHFWVSIIIGFLSLQVAGGVTAILLSVGDPSVSIVPNYHQAALDWDVTHRARQLTGNLGWQINCEVTAQEDSKAARPLLVTVHDKNGQAVKGLLVMGKVYRHARGSTVDRLRLTEIADGKYLANTILVENGLWQIELRFEGDHGIASLSRELEVR